MIQFSKLGVLSPDGRCKSFLDAADGYVRSEGCGVVVLTRLSTALAAHSHVYGVLRGTAINSDGHRSPSLTMPSQQAQMEVFEAALRDARVHGSAVWYAEAHATGTKVGDPIEANAIGKVLGAARRRTKSLSPSTAHPTHADVPRSEDGTAYPKHTEKDSDLEYAHTNGFFLPPTSPSPALSSPSSPTSLLPPPPSFSSSSPSSPLLLGAVKTHVGHLETASFMAGLIKCLLMLQHETLVPNQHDGGRGALNPAIGWDEWGMEVVREVTPFDRRGKVLMVSSFGFGGSNGAAVIEAWDDRQQPEDEEEERREAAEAAEATREKVREKENGHVKVNGGINGHSHAHTNGHSHSPTPSVPPSPPTRLLASAALSPPPPSPPPPPYLFLLSALTPAALDARIAQFREALSLMSSASLDPYAVSYTLATRPHHRHVSYCVASSLTSPSSLVFSSPKRLSTSPSPLVWCFAGQGPQHPMMGRTLYSAYPVFRASINDMDAVYRAVSGHSLVEDVGLFGSVVGDADAVYELRYTLPALVFLQVALVDLWRSLGVTPVAVFGHSFGEMAAAYAAGVCGKKQIVETAYHRAKLLARIDGCGVMMAVGAAPQQLQAALDQWPEQAWIAAYNGPASVTVGGTAEAVKAIAAHCLQRGLFHRVLKITNAYHTPLMRPCKDEALATFSSTLSGVGRACLPYFSTVHSAWKEDGFDAQYTWAGIEGAVHFSDAVSACRERFGPDTAFMEVSAHPVLSSYLLECGAQHAVVTLHRQQGELESVHKLLAQLLVLGLPIRFSSLLPPTCALPSFLPYPFQRQYCHREDVDHRYRREVPSHHPLAGREVSGITRTFEQKVGVHTHDWVVDHVVQGAVVFPAAGYVEMAMEALGVRAVERVAIGRGMILGEAYRTVRTVLSADNDSVRIYSKKDVWDHNPWTLHVTAHRPSPSLPPAASPPSPPSPPSWVSSVPSRCPVAYSARVVYERFRSVSLTYGPLFQGVTAMSVGDLEAWGTMDVRHIRAHSQAFVVHPALLDSTFHVLLGTIRYLHLPYVPTHIGRVEWYLPPHQLPDSLLVFARSRMDGDRLEGDLVICDHTATSMVGSVTGMQCTALGMNEKSVQPMLSARWQQWAVPGVFVPQRSSSWAAIPADVLSYERAMDDACVLYVSDMLAANAASPTPLRTSDWPLHRQRYWQWCQDLVASRPRVDDAVRTLHALSSSPSYPFGKEVEALTRAGSNLHALLSDPFAVQRVLFSDALMGELYSSSLTFRPYVRLMSELVVDYVAAHPDRVIHILEMGAGTGALTSDLLTLLSSSLPPSSLAGRLKYWYTDVSPKFLNDARQRFAAFPFIEYGLLNVDGVGGGAGCVPAHSLDVVLAFDVLHVSSSLGGSLDGLKRLMAPNALLMAIELTRPWLWVQMFFGLFAGWWSMDDGRPTCWLQQQAWEERLASHGFSGVHVLNDRDERGGKEFCHSLITAHAPDLAAVLSSPPLPSSRVVHVFDASDPGHDVEYLLGQAQQLLALTEPHDLFLLTDDAQNVPSAPSSSSALPVAPPHQALHVGFARVLSNEAGQQHRVFMLDLEQDTADERRLEWLSLVTGLRDRTVEREFAVRGLQLYVPRFVPFHPQEPDAVPSEGLSVEEGLPPFRLEVDTVGQLSSLRYHLTPTPSTSPSALALTPAPEEVVVRVHASALNFKDLMLALGMLTNPMGVDRQQLQFDPPTAVGIEFSGVVQAVGAKVSAVRVGDAVFGIGKHCLANVVVTHEHFVALKPKHLTHEEAASMPIVFTTAYAGLIDKARVQPGERVLVHSAAGGIGQAAIQLCKDAGAEVICTVGSATKRQFLTQRYGVTAFADSHSNASWHDEVLALTEGVGVDVVLNSLKGEAIPLGLSLLTVGGRFVEIGKVDMLANAPLPMRLLLRDVSFLSVQLDVLMAGSTAALRRSLRAVAAMAEERRIGPLVDRVFGCGEVEAAFRYLMAGQHMGKVVIDFSPTAQRALLTPSPASAMQASAIFPPSHPFSGYDTYVLTGGTGAVGLRVVQYIAMRGGRHFLLFSRRGAASLRPSEQAELNGLQRFGVRVLITATDITSLDSITDAYAAALSAGFPRRVALLHLAMVLDDDPIPRLTEARLSSVIACKVDGAVNLIAAFPAADVSFAVFFSSAASVLGNPSQANYAAANAFLDAFAFRLTAAGYRARTINLGVVSDVGVLAEDYKLRQLLLLKGFAGGLTSLGVCHAVEAVVRDVREERRVEVERMQSQQQLLGAFDWDAVVSSYPILHSRFAHLVDHTLSQQTAAASASGDTAASLDTVRALVAGLLGVAVDKLDVTEALTRQGLDSLLAVELSAVLKKRLSCNLSQMELLGGMSVEAIWEVVQNAGGGAQ